MASEYESRLRPMISIQNLNKYHGTQHILDSVDIEIESGEFVCLLGPSGCGKSTLLNVICGLDVHYSGTVRVMGKPPGTGKIPLAYLFQDPRLLPWLNVADNIKFALRAADVPSEHWDQRVSKYLALVGLSGIEQRYIHQLSGGMRHRVAIARAFAVEPEILLMDEPFSSLDELTARDIRIELLKIWSEQRKTVVFVTHNAMEATFLADRVLLLDRGPARLREERKNPLTRPRQYDSPELFEENRATVASFLRILETS